MKIKVDVESVFNRANSIYNLVQTMIVEGENGSLKEFQGIVYQKKDDGGIELFFERDKTKKEFPELLEKIILNLPSENEQVEEMILNGFLNGEDLNSEPDKEQFVSFTELRSMAENYNLEVSVFESNYKEKMRTYFQWFVAVSVFSFGFVLLFLRIFNVPFMIVSLINLIFILFLAIRKLYQSSNFYWSAGSEGFECEFCDVYGITTESFRNQKDFFKSFGQKSFNVPNFFKNRSVLKMILVRA